MKEGYVYVLYLPQFGYYKIGYSKNPKKRFTHYDTCLPFDYNVILLFKTQSASTLESSLHYKYNEYRVKNEWFCLDTEHAIEMICIILENDYTQRKYENTDNIWIDFDWFNKEVCLHDFINRESYPFSTNQIKYLISIEQRVSKYTRWEEAQ